MLFDYFAQDFVKIEKKGSFVHVCLNRPDKHNAFHLPMIKELLKFFTWAGDNHDTALRDIHAIVITASGRHFCAGADLQWMQESIECSFDENKRQAVLLADMLLAMHQCPLPIVTAASGCVFGGGLGIVACSDSVFTTDNTHFCLSEVKFGLIPATISPFVMEKIGPSWMRRLSVSAHRFDAKMAQKINLIHHIVDDLDKAIEIELKLLKDNDLVAMRQAKILCHTLVQENGHALSCTKMHEKATLLAKLRTTDTAQKRLKQFFVK